MGGGLFVLGLKTRGLAREEGYIEKRGLFLSSYLFCVPKLVGDFPRLQGIDTLIKFLLFSSFFFFSRVLNELKLALPDVHQTIN